uniref:Uncharacterized protein n=1 Tax=Cacopsylla melanoneura TaxID=428564 RepID=A0A8D9EAK9_9HEMI
MNWPSKKKLLQNTNETIINQSPSIMEFCQSQNTYIIALQEAKMKSAGFFTELTFELNGEAAHILRKTNMHDMPIALARKQKTIVPLEVHKYLTFSIGILLCFLLYPNY